MLLCIPLVGSFLLLGSFPWYGYASLFNHLPIGRLLGCFQFGDIMNKADMNIYLFIYQVPLRRPSGH